MNINELTIGQSKELAALFKCNTGACEQSPHPFNLGKNYFLRTVTHHHTGTLVLVTEHELVLKNALFAKLED
jgi:hypothetical protein